MLVLVLGANFLVMFVGWEGVGLCSYLLIGFWFQKKSAADAGKKAFIVNRIGDFGFVLGVLLLWTAFGTIDFRGVAEMAAGYAPEETFGRLSLITLLLFVGATGKSAQIPLYVWLPDAMEGPTPVSALIHAATMVTAGVYMIGRNAVLFAMRPRRWPSSRSSARPRRSWRARSGWCRTTSSACSPIRPCRSSATCSWRWASARSAPASSISTPTRSSRRCCSSDPARSFTRSRASRTCGGWAGSRAQLPITYWTFLDRRARDRRRAGPGRLLQQGRDPVPHVRERPSRAVGRRRAHVAADRRLHVPPRVPGVPRRAARGRGTTRTRHGAPCTRHRAPCTGTARGILHDAPPAMALALVVLAVGSIAAGYIGVPHALGGSNRLEQFLAPSFEAGAAEGRARRRRRGPRARSDGGVDARRGRGHRAGLLPVPPQPRGQRPPGGSVCRRCIACWSTSTTSTRSTTPRSCSRFASSRKKDCGSAWMLV